MVHIMWLLHYFNIHLSEPECLENWVYCTVVLHSCLICLPQFYAHDLEIYHRAVSGYKQQPVSCYKQPVFLPPPQQQQQQQQQILQPIDEQSKWCVVSVKSAAGYEDTVEDGYKHSAADPVTQVIVVMPWLNIYGNDK